MITLADSSPRARKRWIARRTRGRFNLALFGFLAFMLAGCIQPDAIYIEGGGPQIGIGTPIFPPTFTPEPGAAPIPTQPIPFPTDPGVVTAAPIPPVAQGTPEPALFIWRFQPVGPEQVAVMFFTAANGVRCARYIYRSKVVERCPGPGQTIVTLAGIEAAADNRQYTIVAGRVLDSRITTVTIQFQDGSSQPLPVASGGYVTIAEGARPVLSAVPIDQNGNLVGPVVPVG